MFDKMNTCLSFCDCLCDVWYIRVYIADSERVWDFFYVGGAPAKRNTIIKKKKKKRSFGVPVVQQLKTVIKN